MLAAPIAVLALAALLLTGALTPPRAQGVAAQTSPTGRVAVVDPLSVINGLDELPVRNQQWQSQVAEAQAGLDNLAREADAIQAELEELNLPEDQAIQKRLKLMTLEGTANAQLQGTEAFLDSERGRVLGTLYRKVLAECERIAKAEGYDAVFINDTSVLPPERGSYAMVQNAIQTRRLVYFNPQVDITERVIREMNASFQAGAGD